PTAGLAARATGLSRGLTPASGGTEGRGPHRPVDRRPAECRGAPGVPWPAVHRARGSPPALAILAESVPPGRRGATGGGRVARPRPGEAHGRATRDHLRMGPTRSGPHATDRRG